VASLLLHWFGSRMRWLLLRLRDQALVDAAIQIAAALVLSGEGHQGVQQLASAASLPASTSEVVSRMC